MQPREGYILGTKPGYNFDFDNNKKVINETNDNGTIPFKNDSASYNEEKDKKKILKNWDGDDVS